MKKQLQKLSRFLPIISGLLCCILLNFNVASVKAADTLKTAITQAQFTTLYGSSTGVVVIAAGGKLILTSEYTAPSGIKEIIIQNGGQIFWNGNQIALKLNINTTLTIENTTDTSATSPTAALYTTNCNNNMALHLGTVKYSACNGGGNVCFLIRRVIAMGGTISLTPNINVSVSNGQIVNGNLCSNTPSNESFILEATIQRNQDFTNPATISWSVVSKPATAPNPQIVSPNSLNTTINTYAIGTYVFRVTIVQNMSTAGCTNQTQNITKEADVTINVFQTPQAVITGGGQLRNDAVPEEFAMVTFTGTQGVPNYTFQYTLNDIAQTSVTSTTGISNFTMGSNSAPGVYKYEITNVSDAQCATNITNQIAYILIHDALPIELNSFQIIAKGCFNNITWTTGSERDFKKFELQSSNESGQNFETIAVIDPKGSNSSYQYSHYVNANESTLYRLKSIDQDDSYSFSKILVAKNQCTQSNPVIVNPIQNSQLIITELVPNKDRVVVTNIQGQVIYDNTINNTALKLDVTRFVSSMYFVQIFRDNELILATKALQY